MAIARLPLPKKACAKLATEVLLFLQLLPLLLLLPRGWEPGHACRRVYLEPPHRKTARKDWSLGARATGFILSRLTGKRPARVGAWAHVPLGYSRATWLLGGCRWPGPATELAAGLKHLRKLAPVHRRRSGRDARLRRARAT